MKFTKMQGCGNDYIYFDCMKGAPIEFTEENLPAVAFALSDRHFGVGGDGIVLILKSDIADAKMRMFNADGSEGAMCGNASRCIGKYLFDNGYLKDKKCTLETKSGVKSMDLHIKNGVCVGATVNMGEAKPLEGCGEFVEVNGVEYQFIGVDVGNPHAVIFTSTPVEEIDLKNLGSAIEKSEQFLSGVNVEFVNTLENNALKMRVWERGSGETLACGTGSCAAAYAAVKSGICNTKSPVTVFLQGGELSVCVTDRGLLMSGPAVNVFTGNVELN